MSRPFKLYIGSFMPGEQRRFLASYSSGQAARDAVPTWFGQFPKNLCWDIALRTPGAPLEVWPHPDRGES